MPKLLTKSSTAYDFWMAFIPTFQQEKDHLQKPQIQEQPQFQFDTLLRRCLYLAIQQWDSAVVPPRTSYGYGYGYTAGPSPASAAVKIARVVQLAEICLSTNALKHCSGLFMAVLKSAGDFPSKLTTLYTPLISELKQVVARKSVDIATYPFGDFLRTIIGLYLVKNLGAKPQTTRIPKLRKIGCGCMDCNSINTFLASNSATLTQQTFRFVKRRRTHVEMYLNTASDLLRYTVVSSGSPHGLAITKRPEIIALAQWTARKKAAREFLTRIGDDVLIAKIMGSQYDGVVKALEGTQAFIITPAATSTTSASTAQPTERTSGPVPQASSSSSQTASAVVLNEPRVPGATPPMAPPLQDISTNVGQVVGLKRKTTPEPVVARQKRKKTPEVHGDVIDLTGDSP